MGKSRAFAGTPLFLVVAPGVVAGVIPWALTDWESGDSFGSLGVNRVVGAVVLLAGVSVVLEAFARFVLEGHGTPAPVAPTGAPRGRQALSLRPEPDVPRGWRHDRRAGLSTPAGDPARLRGGVLRRRCRFVRWYEEPTLARTYGGRYEAYRRPVPGWLPRRTPWEGDVP